MICSWVKYKYNIKYERSYTFQMKRNGEDNFLFMTFTFLFLLDAMQLQIADTIYNLHGFIASLMIKKVNFPRDL